MNTLTQTESFVDERLLRNLGSLTKAQADQFPFGIVQLDDAGNVMLYNKYNEEHFANFSEQDVKGKNYFEEVAPCTSNFMFSGRFRKGVESGSQDIEFDYNFTYRVKPTRVRIRLYRDEKTGTNWVFLKEKNNIS